MSSTHSSSSSSSSCVPLGSGPNNKENHESEISDSSVDDILPSLRMADREFPRASILTPSFFELGKPKSLSTNSSPIKSSLKMNTASNKAPNSALAGTGFSLDQDITKKSVRFNDLLDSQKKKTQPTRRKRDSFFHRNPSKYKASSLNDTKRNIEPTNIRVDSSEYSCTPDVTDFTQLDVPNLSEKQLKYLLPEMVEPLVKHREEKNEPLRSLLARKSKKRSEALIPEYLQKTPEIGPTPLSDKGLFSDQNIKIASGLSSESVRNSGISSVSVPDVNLPSEKTGGHTESAKLTFYKTATMDKVPLTGSFKGLSLKSQENSIKSKGFSLRLQGCPPIKPSSRGTPDVSYDHDQVDILDQVPPNLPNITANSILLDKEELSRSNLTVGLFENSITKDKFQDIVLKLSKALDNTYIDQNMYEQLSLQDSIDIWKNLSEEAIKRLDSFMVQNVNNSKTLSENQVVISNKELTENTLKEQIRTLKKDVDSYQSEISKLESKVDSQLKEITFEREGNSNTIEQLRSQIRHLKQLKYENEEKDMISDQISNLIDRFKNELIKDVNKNKLEFLVSQKGHVTDYDTLKLIFISATSNCESLEESMKVNDDLRSLNKQLQENYKQLEELSRDSAYKCKTAENELQKSQRKLQEVTELSNLLEFQVKESLCELKSTQLNFNEQNEANKELRLKVSNMESTINEELNVIKAAHDQIDSQSKDLQELAKAKETLNIVHRQKESLLNDLDINKSNLHDIKCELEKLKKEHSLVNEEKDGVINSLKQVNSDLTHEKTKLVDELRETRSKLSDATSNLRDLERRLNNSSSTITELQTANRSLKSEILQNSSIRTHYKRILIELLISMLHEFQGIIDEKSLSGAKDDLKVTDKIFDNASDHEKELVNLSDCSFFIQDAVSLVINDYWDIHKKLANNKKIALSSSSLNTLQRINDSQTSKIKKLEFKVKYYESLFKKLNQDELRTNYGFSQVNEQADNEEDSSTSVITTRVTKQERLIGKAKRAESLDY